MTFCRICSNLSVKTAGNDIQKLQSLDFRNVGFEWHFKQALYFKNCSHWTEGNNGLSNDTTWLQWSTACITRLWKIQWNYSGKLNTVETCSFWSEKVCSVYLSWPQVKIFLKLFGHQVASSSLLLKIGILSWNFFWWILLGKKWLLGSFGSIFCPKMGLKCPKTRLFYSALSY